MRLGDFLREERKKRTWSLKELGERLKSPRDGGAVSPQYLNDVEMSRRTPSPQILEQLAKLLGTDAAILRAMSDRGSAEVDQYLSDQPDKSPQVGRLFRKARQTGFTNWERLEEVMTQEHPQPRKKK